MMLAFCIFFIALFYNLQKNLSNFFLSKNIILKKAVMHGTTSSSTLRHLNL